MNDYEDYDLSGSIYTPDFTDDLLGLRLRSRIEHLDLSGNTRAISLDRIQSANEEIFYRTKTKTVGESMISLYLQGMMALLRFFNFTYSGLQTVLSTTRKVSTAVRQSLSDELYVFFEGSIYPYPLHNLQLDHPGSPPIEWYYNSTTQVFISSRLYVSSQSYPTKHIPYLSTEVKYNDLTLYDISEFMNTLRWAGEEGRAMPTAPHLLAAWTLSSGIVLKVSNDMVLFVTDTDGEDHSVSLRNDT